MNAHVLLNLLNEIGGGGGDKIGGIINSNNLNARLYLSYDTKIAINLLFLHQNANISPLDKHVVLMDVNTLSHETYQGNLHI